MILIVNLCEELLHYYEFVKPIEDVLKGLKTNFETIHYKKIKPWFYTRADKIIICGTSLRDNRFLKKINEFKWMEKIDKPLLGICAGMQILGLLHRGEIKKGREVGLHEILFEKTFLGFKGRKEVYELHNFYVESPDFEVYARSKQCPQAVKHKKKTFYGVLFHPEVRNKELIKNFVTS